ncbi:MAG: hypothetical protein JST08_03030 [Actinobacteria bacterium]|nr:hypothetical protein [Actinomycetota bacterium]
MRLLVQPRRAVRAARITLCTVALAAAVTLAGAASPVGAGAVEPETPRSDLTTCFWTYVVGPPPAVNAIFPDQHAYIWHTWFVIPPGGSVVLHGEYPHARSIAFSTYTVETPYDVLRDEAIEPEPGSVNPFLPNADRKASARSYSLTVTSAPLPRDPSARRPNTLYAGKELVSLFYREYVPDAGRDATGGAGLPALEYTPAGQRGALTGPRACAAVGAPASRLPSEALPFALSLTTPAYLALLAQDPFSNIHPAVSPLRWYAWFNLARLAQPFLEGTLFGAAVPLLPTAKEGPAANWEADSGIAYAYIDRKLGPARGGHNVLVLQGRKPTTPRTGQGQPVMEAGTQLRYWDICQNDSIPLANYVDCLDDEEVPVDAAGNYTVVVSLPQDRPADAIATCGVAWLDWGTVGDGVVRPTAGLLMLRNQDPSPPFTQAIQNVGRPGEEQRVMGAYLPTGTYQSRAQFERAHGCPTQ